MWHAGCEASLMMSQRTGFQPFTSESYPEDARPDAWQDVLKIAGLQRISSSWGQSPHATASYRQTEGVALVRLSAGPQSVAPLASGSSDLPLVLMPIEDEVVLKTARDHRTVSAKELVLVPRRSQCSLVFNQTMRALVLSVTSEAYHGRKIDMRGIHEAHVVEHSGLSNIFVQMLETTSLWFETLSDPEWSALARSLSDFLPLFLPKPLPSTEPIGTHSQSAILHRICQTIEYRLGDPDLNPSRVAATEGISERYVQKLFVGLGSNFTTYVRERRLQRAWSDLSNPADAHQSISEIAYRVGFGDPAHFSRAFRHRFGVPPREFRRQEAERLMTSAATTEQRGWPAEALVQLRGSSPTVIPRKEVASGDFDTLSRSPNAQSRHHHLAVDASNVHWGYFSRGLEPRIEIGSGDTITIETLTQHASDDPERMIAHDPGAESVFLWTREQKNVDRRGAGPMDASVYGRGAGEGFGVHICTGPIAIRDAEPGDVLEVRILDIVPRRSRNPDFEGQSFGSNVSAWWGYHYNEIITEPKQRESVMIYEIFDQEDVPHARAIYSYLWEPQVDPSGVLHNTYDYPGIPISPDSVRRRHAVLDGIRVPLRPHFGVIAVAPSEAEFVDSVPPSYFGGNIDNWRLGKGAAVYLPVSVAGALLSVGDPHAAQGDGELGGTAIECSMTGTLQVVLHKKTNLSGTALADLTYPLIETETDWVLTGFSHPNYLAEFGAKGQSEVYNTSSLDLAMKDAFRKMRRFLMTIKGLSEDEAVALMSVAVDFGVTQVVDGNWGAHAILSKSVFDDPESQP
jgi:acetamidase/formamidase/AraC-like DNA-binding protein